MPTLEWNKSEWDGLYNWDERGEEWSAVYGGSESQWYTCLFPRVARFLPADKILEIAPGHGRWTRFLLNQCNGYRGVDLSARCVESCREFFKQSSHAEFFQNDGSSLDMISDDSIDFCFSYDSLVHVEMDVINLYIEQIVRKLTPTGIAFLHHSNLGDYPGEPNPHLRADTVSAKKTLDTIERFDGKVILQEKFNWGYPKGIFSDCHTVFCKKIHPNAQTIKSKIINNDFHEFETSYSKNIISSFTAQAPKYKPKQLSPEKTLIHTSGYVDTLDGKLLDPNKRIFDINKHGMSKINFSGWIADIQGKRIFNEGYVLINDLLHEAAMRIRRPDLAVAYGDEFLHAGYRAEIETEYLPVGIHDVRVIGVSEDGDYYAGEKVCALNVIT